MKLLIEATNSKEIQGSDWKELKGFIVSWAKKYDIGPNDLTFANFYIDFSSKEEREQAAVNYTYNPAETK